MVLCPARIMSSVSYLRNGNDCAMLGLMTYAQFLTKLDRTTECWLWTGFKVTHGYGGLMHEGVMMSAHRWSYQYHLGPIAKGMHIHHKCRVKHCVNPDHLEMLTPLAHAKHNPPAKKTHCLRGHPLTEFYKSIRPDGTYSRRCKVCHLDLCRRRDMARGRKR